MIETKTTDYFKKEVYELVGDEYTVLGEYKNNSTKILMRHNTCQYEWETTPHAFLQGRRCPKCSKRIRKDTDYFKKEVYELVGDEYTVLGEYKNNSTKILMRHNTCQYEWEIAPDKFLQGRRCPKCSKRIRKDTDYFKKEVYELVGDEYEVLGEYKNTHSRILMRHNTCQYEWETTPDIFLQGSRCPKCSKRIRKDTDYFKKEVYELVGDEYEVLGEYKNAITKILMRHNTCQYEWEILPNSFLQGDRCPKCSKRIRKDTDYFKKEVYELVGDEYTVLGEYKNTHSKILMRHNTCQYEWEIKPNNFLNGQRCPKCSMSNGTSNLEHEILDFIKSIYNKKIETNYRCIETVTEVDIFLPEDKLAIEIDGLYWHSETCGKNKDYHLNKTILCKQQDIRLIHIFEDEWIEKQEIVKSKLKYLLELSKDLPKIRASKCFITELTTLDKNQFLNENHIQGEDKASIKLGLWYPINDEEDRLVSVMTFCKPRKALGYSKDNSKQKYDYELSRFATDIEYQVYGAFDKLFKYFKENYEWNSIKTYADRRWSVGGLYENTGFKLFDISKPNYWYCKNNQRYHRFGFRKTELEKKFPELYNKDNTEFEIMDKTNYHRIWDCGNYVYTYTRTN